MRLDKRSNSVISQTQVANYLLQLGKAMRGGSLSRDDFKILHYKLKVSYADKLQKDDITRCEYDGLITLVDDNLSLFDS